jgi:uncharacterized protein (TIGR00730 family)
MQLINERMTILSVGVFCGAQKGTENKYTDFAYECGKRLAENSIRVVYGGSNSGLMQLVCDGSYNNNGKVTGVYPRFMDIKEPIRAEKLSELIIVEDLYERKKIMIEHSDAFFILPGGYGTLDELFEVLTLRKLNVINKPIILINYKGFWDQLLPMLDSIESEQFAKPGVKNQLLTVVSTLDEAFNALGIK